MRGAWISFFCLAACGEAEVAKPAAERFELDVDIREHAEARVEQTGEDLSVELGLSRGFGVAKDGAKLTGKGKLERFPEADVVLITAKLSSAPVAGGPCGAEPVSLALALHRRGAATRVSGSLTPYCGKDTWAGTPARNPLRLSTTAPPEE